MHKKALITGASSGIGSAVARLLAEKKMSLILTGRNGEALQQIADEARSLGAEAVRYFTADLATDEGQALVVEAIESEKPDLLINNAGFGLYGDAIKLDLGKQEEMLEINTKALFKFSAIAGKMMVENGIEGVILNVSSVASFPPFPGFAAYSASKAFVNQLSICMDYELKGRGVRVLSACPGVVVSKFRERAGGVPTIATSPGTMSADYAAKQIWWQIQKKKQVHLFNWRYRLMIWLTRFIMPKGMVAGMLHQNISALSQEDL